MPEQEQAELTCMNNSEHKYTVLAGQQDPFMCPACVIKVKHDKDVRDRLPKMIELVDTLRRVDTQLDREAFIEALMREHRTNQQYIFDVVMQCIAHWSRMWEKGAGWFDARNATAVETSAHIMDSLPENLKYRYTKMF